jgi:hypothetical protein
VSVLSERRFDTDWYVGLQRHILANSRFAPLAQLIPQSPEQLADFDVAFKAHTQAILQMRLFLDPAWQPLIVGAIDGYARGDLRITTPPATDEGLAQAEQLAWRGYCFRPSLNPDRVAEMRRYFESQPVEIERDGRRHMASLDEGRGYSLAYYKPAVTIACPRLAELAADPQIVATVAKYLGAPPTILNYAAWWSFAGTAPPEGSQIFHCDADDYRFCKLFFYLTDVGADGGPHMYMAGTHKAETIDQARKSWSGGEEAFDAWYRRQYRKSDDDVLRAFRQQPTALTGAAGTSFLVDTGGIHKGRHPEGTDRLVVQVEFGVSGALPIDYKDEGWEPVDIADLPGVRPIGDARLFSYLNRLFIRV